MVIEHCSCCDFFIRILDLLSLSEKLEKMMTTLTELGTVLQTVDAQLDKATAEILKAIQDLRDQLANVSLPPEAEATLTALETKVQALDDIVPDQA